MLASEPPQLRSLLQINWKSSVKTFGVYTIAMAIASVDVPLYVSWC